VITAHSSTPFRPSKHTQGRWNPLADLARALSARLDQDDRLLIVECNDHAAWRALMPTTVEWLDNVFIGARKADHRANFRVA
jgi:hypothetical protein